jgi:flagellar basal-body rod protein FlgG
MFRQFRVAATGLNSLEKELLTITNNVSNVETVAFKRSRVDYENLFPEILQNAVAENDNRVKPAGLEYGSGVRVAATPKDFSAGTTTVTNNPTDMAIKGDGFFKVQLRDGSIAYTRAGNFSVDANGRLVDVNGNPTDPEITFSNTVTGITINTDGSIYVQENNQLTQSQIGQIELVRFQNPSGLQGIGSNLYKESVASGVPISGNPGEQGFGEIAQFSLESSNVDIIEELTCMIIVQRAFDIVSKSVQSGEAMLNSAIEIARG